MFTGVDDFKLPTLNAYHKKRFLGFAMQVLEAQQQMITPSGKSILHYVLKRKTKYINLKHYPEGDRIDDISGAQYFYHCHRENKASREHGHFHCFLRYKHIAKAIKPAKLPDWDIYLENPMTHLVAIAMNLRGEPIRLFTVNRWVTSEIWYEACQVEKLLKRFRMQEDGDTYWSVLDRWIEGMLHLFAPQVIWLQQARDRCIDDYRLQNGVDNPLIDQNLEELSTIAIDLKKQVEWLVS
jgi:hypothetical protein